MHMSLRTTRSSAMQRMRRCLRPRGTAPPPTEFRERVGRMLEGVAGQRAQRLDFAGGGQPAPHRRARVRPPVFHLKRQVRRPEDEQLQHAHQHVVARIQVLHQPLQARQVPRGRLALGIRAMRAGRPAWDSGTARVSRRTSTSESRPSSWAASSTADHRRAQHAAVPVQEPAVDHQGHQEQVAQEAIHGLAVRRSRFAE